MQTCKDLADWVLRYEGIIYGKKSGSCIWARVSREFQYGVPRNKSIYNSELA